MNFIVILVALLLDQVLRPLEHFRAHPWYESPLRALAAHACAAGDFAEVFAPYAVSFVPAFAAGALAWGFVSLNAAAGFVFGVLVLVLCLGPRDLAALVTEYLKARAGNDGAAAAAAARLVLEAEPPEDERERAAAVADGVLCRAGDWLFSVVFWFALLGPLGAVLFRAADLVAVRASADAPGTLYARSALRLKLVMNWIPLHLLALTYAVAGSFDEAMNDIRKAYGDTGRHFLERGEDVVARAGAAAIRGIAGANADEVELLHAAVDVIWRGVVIWMTAIGVITLLGWLF